MVWKILIAVGAAVLVTWLILLIALVAARPSRGVVREGLRILPDTVRLLRRLMAEPAMPRSVRFRVGATLLYLAIPIDLVPDFLPGIGYADDVIIVAATLRSAIRHAGIDSVQRLWPGTAEGLSVLLQLTGLDRDTP